MKTTPYLRRCLALMLLAVLLLPLLPAARADDYYFGETQLPIFDGAYNLTVDKHWTLEADYEIPSKLHVHDRFWTWKQWCIKDNHNQKVIRFFKETYPYSYENEAANTYLMKSFARYVGHLRPVQYAVQVGYEIQDKSKGKSADELTLDDLVLKDEAPAGKKPEERPPTDYKEAYEYREYSDYTSYPIKVNGWQALQLIGFQYKAVVVMTGEEILYFASQHLTLEELTDIIKTLELGPGEVG